MAHTSTSNKLSFSTGWYALNFVSMCIKNVQCLIFKYAFKSVSNLFRICVFPLFIKMFQPGNFIFGNSDIFSLLLQRIRKDFNILNQRDDTFSASTALIRLGCFLHQIIQIIHLYLCVFEFVSLHVYFEKKVEQRYILRH